MAITWDVLAPRPIAGAVFALKVSIVDRVGAAVDITGWTFEVWAQNIDDVTEDVNWSSYVVVTSAAGGVLTISVPRSITKTSGGKKYRVDVCRVDSGNDAVVATGTVPFDDSSRPTSE